MILESINSLGTRCGGVVASATCGFAVDGVTVVDRGAHERSARWRQRHHRSTVAFGRDSLRIEAPTWGLSRLDVRVARLGLAIGIIGILVALGAWLYPDVLGVVVRREPHSTQGDHPFMPPAGQDLADVAAPPDTSGTFAGDEPGLFGGTLNIASCDSQQMVTRTKRSFGPTCWASSPTTFPPTSPG